MAATKTWKQKLDIKMDRKIVPLPARMHKQWGADGTILVPHPKDVDAALRRIPKGRIVTMGELRAQLAQEFGATTTCPLCTGMFWRIAAEAAEEAHDGKLPYWRVVKDDGALNPKLPGGVAGQARHLKEEGHFVSGGAKPKINFPSR